jgi:signal transduction histidine kinase
VIPDPASSVVPVSVMNMGIPLRLTALASRARVRRTVRLRLTLLYGGLFLVCGAGLLAITYLLVHQFSGRVSFARYGPVAPARPGQGSAARLPPLPPLAQLQSRAQHALARQHANDLHQLLVWSLVALAAMTLVSLVLGWLAAGRVLSPLRTMTATTRRISHDTLHERLALQGPSDELKELGDTIDGLLARLQEAFEAQRQFIANVSHELRTPLARIRTAVDVAVGKPAPVPPQVMALDRKVREGLDRADRLLESFLTLGRAQHGEFTDRRAVSLEQIVSSTLAEHELEIAAKRIEVEQDLRGCVVGGSPTLLSRMVENVIDNGVRHNTPGGWIRVELAPRDDRVHLTVESGGVLLDDGHVRELTRPFRRLAPVRTGSDNGVGLGLSIVAAIAAAHSGTLELHARPQGGLRVVIWLPQSAPDVETGPVA